MRKEITVRYFRKLKIWEFAEGYCHCPRFLSICPPRWLSLSRWIASLSNLTWRLLKSTGYTGYPSTTVYMLIVWLLIQSWPHSSGSIAILATLHASCNLHGIARCLLHVLHYTKTVVMFSPILLTDHVTHLTWIQQVFDEFLRELFIKQ